MFFALSLHAQNRLHSVRGTIVDGFTGEGLAAKIFLMTNDSTVIDTTTAEVVELPDGTGGTEGWYEFRGVTEKGHYIVRAVLDGYEDSYRRCELRSTREEYISVDKMYMHQLHELNEVTVTSTKIKMVMRGDTIVYNANAFNLAEGSMLDALVARLPGAKLTKDGKIYVNGKYVENLLVNGHDFFSGSPKVALENLPAYSVSKIKVFDKAGHVSEMMGQDMGDKTYTMDVRLKKEYSTGYMGNLEAGIGTQHRYTSRGLLMKFSDRERIGTYFNMNNLNDNQRAKLDGQWSPEDMPDGLLATKIAGLSYIRFLNGYNEWFESSVDWEHNSADIITKTNTQTYLPGGDVFRKAVSLQQSSRDNWSSRNRLILYKKGGFSSNFLNVSYMKRTGWGTEAQKDSVKNSILSQLMEDNSFQTKDFNFSFRSNNGLKVIADNIGWNVNLTYNRNKQYTLTSSDVQYPTAGLPHDLRVRYLNAPNQNLRLDAGADYTFGFHTRNVMLGYSYSYLFNKSDNLLYRLDRLGSGPYKLDDLLPSSALSIASALDNGNTFFYREHRNEHKVMLKYDARKSKLFGANLTLELPVRLLSSSLSYERAGYYGVSRRNLFFEPTLRIENPEAWNIQMGVKSEFPEMTLLVNYMDDSTPLYVREGNAGLRNIHKYYVEGGAFFHSTHQQAINIRAGYHQTDNAVAYSLVYDKANSLSRIRPVSVNGNWNVDGSIGFTRALDKAQKFTVDNQLTAEYRHSVDMATFVGSLVSERSVVRNMILGDELRVDYQPVEGYSFSLHGAWKYYSISSKREDFADIHATDYNVGFNTTLTLPWEFRLTTDMTMFARCGYQQSELNTTDWIWNAQLSRAFFSGRLLTKLQAFDLFHQLNSVRYAVNEQGRVETWRNSIPRYLMLSLAWKFNINPKKKR